MQNSNYFEFFFLHDAKSVNSCRNIPKNANIVYFFYVFNYKTGTTAPYRSKKSEDCFKSLEEVTTAWATQIDSKQLLKNNEMVHVIRMIGRNNWLHSAQYQYSMK